MTDVGTCPTCGRPFPSLWKPSRICAACTKPILKGHKFTFGPDSRVRHRNCVEPDSYAPAPTESVATS
jgi:hypothetical protein